MELIRSTTEKRSRFTRWFSRKAITYLVICGFLTFVNWYTSPAYWWVVWVIAGWGLGLALSLLYYWAGCDDERHYDEK